MENKINIISPNADLVKQLVSDLKCSEIFAQVAAGRGLKTADAVRKFLAAPLSAIDLDNCILDMDKAVARISHALQNGERILIFGDYDVDGITSTLVLKDFLSQCGADVIYYIPHRRTEGYGMFPHHVEALASEIGTKPSLVITVDCGASGRQAIKAAKNMGIDVIVTDHHRVDEEIPEAVAFVDPKRPQCKSGKDYLCGVGIVFLLLIHLRKHLRSIDFWQQEADAPNLKQYCDLVALGTIADVSPLTFENRVFVKSGLAVLNSSPRLGLKALIEQNCGAQFIDTQVAAFRIIPVLNAAGRMEHADQALKLLEAKQQHTAQTLVNELLALNRKRQSMEQSILSEITAAIKANPQLLSPKALIMTGKDWHEGVLGILASRLAETYQKPVLILSEHDGVFKGSGRTPDYVDLFQALSSCGHLLANFGGHRLAAGLTMPAENIEAFREAFEAALNGVTPMAKTITADCELPLAAINVNLLNELTQLEPFGEGNNEPLFVANNVEVVNSRILGTKSNHLKLRVKQNNSQTFDAIHFGYDKMHRPGGVMAQMLFHLRFNEWDGQKKIQLVLIKT